MDELSRTERLAYLVTDATGTRVTRMSARSLIAVSARRRFTLDAQDRLVELNSRGRRIRTQPPVRLNCPHCGRPMFRDQGDRLADSYCQSCGETGPTLADYASELRRRIEAFAPDPNCPLTPLIWERLKEHAIEQCALLGEIELTGDPKQMTTCLEFALTLIRRSGDNDLGAAEALIESAASFIASVTQDSPTA